MTSCFICNLFFRGLVDPSDQLEELNLEEVRIGGGVGWRNESCWDGRKGSVSGNVVFGVLTRRSAYYLDRVRTGDERAMIGGRWTRGTVVELPSAGRLDVRCDADAGLTPSERSQVNR